MENSPEFLTVAETAAVLRISRMSVYRLANLGVIPCVKIGRSYRIPARELENYLERNHNDVNR